jgi:hypothetical protein
MVNADFLNLIETDEQFEQCCSDGRRTVSTFMAESAGRCQGQRRHNVHHYQGCIALHHITWGTIHIRGAVPSVNNVVVCACGCCTSVMQHAASSIRSAFRLQL